MQCADVGVHQPAAAAPGLAALNAKQCPPSSPAFARIASLQTCLRTLLLPQSSKSGRSGREERSHRSSRPEKGREESRRKRSRERSRSRDRSREQRRRREEEVPKEDRWQPAEAAPAAVEPAPELAGAAASPGEKQQPQSDDKSGGYVRLALRTACASWAALAAPTISFPMPSHHYQQIIMPRHHTVRWVGSNQQQQPSALRSLQPPGQGCFRLKFSAGLAPSTCLSVKIAPSLLMLPARRWGRVWCASVLHATGMRVVCLLGEVGSTGRRPLRWLREPSPPAKAHQNN